MIAVLWMQDEVSAAAVARMVDMSLEEVADLLGGAAASGPGDTDTALLAREAAQVLLQLEAAICSGQSDAVMGHEWHVNDATQAHAAFASQQMLTVDALHG